MKIYTKRFITHEIPAPSTVPQTTRDTFSPDVQECGISAWEQKWAYCDIAMEGDEDAQTVLRYVIYQLVANGSPRDHTVSIGALGLTHTRYKGCYFWGTDLFLTPFYNLTNPRATRSLANFRVGTLPQAKAHAARMNGAGARYPWMLSYDSSEQCESWDISGDEASYHQVCFDWLQRYQVIKQADALLLMTRLPEQFTGKERLAA